MIRVTGLATLSAMALFAATGCAGRETRVRAPSEGVAESQGSPAPGTSSPSGAGAPAGAPTPAATPPGSPPPTGTSVSAVAAAPAGLPPSEGPEQAPPPSTVTPPPPDTAGYGSYPPGHDPHREWRTLGWISLAIGAEAAVIAVATSIMISHQSAIRNDNCNEAKVCNPTGFGAVGTIDTIVPWNTASWIVAAAGLGAGTILLVISQPKSEHPTALTVSPSGSGMSFGVRSSF